MEFLADKTVIAEPKFLEKMNGSKFEERFAKIKCVERKECDWTFNGADVSYSYRESLRKEIDDAQKSRRKDIEGDKNKNC